MESRWHIGFADRAIGFFLCPQAGGSERTDVLDGYLGVDVVVGAHGDLDDYKL